MNYLNRNNYVFIQADQSGAEALIVAYLCRNGNFRALFENGIKPHIFMAMHLFADYWAKELRIASDKFRARFLDCDICHLNKQEQWKELSTKIKKHDEYYYVGKKTIHSFNYEQSYQSMIFVVLKESEGKVVLSMEQGKRIKEVHEYLFPEIYAWHNEVKETIRNERMLRNLFGFPLRFYGVFTDKLFREAISTVPQSTVGCIGSMAFCRMQSFVESNQKQWDVMNNKHDSVLIQVPNDETEILAAATILRSFLEVDLISPKDGTKFKMKSEVSVGRNWGKYNNDCIKCSLTKDECKCGCNYTAKNPDGMKELII